VTRLFVMLTPGLCATLLLLVVSSAGIGHAKESRLIPATADNVPTFIERLHDPDLQHRRDAAHALSDMNPLPTEAIQPLADSLNTAPDNDALHRYVFLALGHGGAAAVPTLVTIARTTKWVNVRGGAIEALSHVAVSEPSARQALLDVLKGDRFAADHEMARAEGQVVPAMIKGLNDKDPAYRVRAAATLGQLSSEPGLDRSTRAQLAITTPELTQALQDSDANVRSQAAIALPYFAPGDSRPARTLGALLADQKYSGQALAALQKMGTAAKDAVPDVEKALAGSQEPGVRTALARVLATNNDRKACEPLAQAIRRDNQDDDFTINFTINRTRDIAASSLVDSYPCARTQCDC
jgi:HEAT repeat protein